MLSLDWLHAMVSYLLPRPVGPAAGLRRGGV